MAAESRGSDEAGALPSRLERYGKARARAREICGHIEHQGEPGLAGKLRGCGNWLLFRHYWTVGKVRLVKATFCRKHLLCPLCAIRRGAKQLAAYLERFRAILASEGPLMASVVTLTVKNGPDLAERFHHLQEGVRLLQQRRRDSRRDRGHKSEWAKVLGLVGTYEVTNKGRGWHPHTHILVLHRESIDQDQLSAEWKGITGDSHVVDVTGIQNPDDPVKDFCEVFKYAMKFSELSLANCYEAFRILSGRRLIFSAGLFRGVEVPEDLKDEPLEGLPFVELLYRYVHGSGYSLEATRDSQAETTYRRAGGGAEPAARPRAGEHQPPAGMVPPAGSRPGPKKEVDGSCGSMLRPDSNRSDAPTTIQ